VMWSAEERMMRTFLFGDILALLSTQLVRVLRSVRVWKSCTVSVQMKQYAFNRRQNHLGRYIYLHLLERLTGILGRYSS